jgi:L-aminopeptidase/D-esterase-like protein
MAWLAARGHGFPTAHGPVPIVPGAVLFDLGVGDPARVPTAAWGLAAAEGATDAPVPCGNVGAGAGATTGKLPGGVPLKGGLGTASFVLASGLTVAALVAVNAAGDVADPASRRLYAEGAPFAPRGGLDALLAGGAVPFGSSPGGTPPIGATTIGVVATDAPLTKAQATKVAQMAQDGIARAVRPAHTMLDGDTLFALATGTATPPPGLPPALLVTAIGAAAADAVCLAIARAIRAADPLPGWPAYRDWSGGG